MATLDGFAPTGLRTYGKTLSQGVALGWNIAALQAAPTLVALRTDNPYPANSSACADRDRGVFF